MKTETQKSKKIQSVERNYHQRKSKPNSNTMEKNIVFAAAVAKRPFKKSRNAIPATPLNHSLLLRKR